MLQICMQLEMDRTNQVESLEELLMFNPLNPESPSLVQETIKTHDYYTSVYPDHIMDEVYENVASKRSIRPPKCIFMPSREVVRIMIKANILYSKQDCIEDFICRFGVITSL